MVLWSPRGNGGASSALGAYLFVGRTAVVVRLVVDGDVGSDGLHRCLGFRERLESVAALGGDLPRHGLQRRVGGDQVGVDAVDRSLQRVQLSAVGSVVVVKRVQFAVAGVDRGRRGIDAGLQCVELAVASLHAGVDAVDRSLQRSLAVEYRTGIQVSAGDHRLRSRRDHVLHAVHLMREGEVTQDRDQREGQHAYQPPGPRGHGGVAVVARRRAVVVDAAGAGVVGLAALVEGGVHQRRGRPDHGLLGHAHRERSTARARNIKRLIDGVAVRTVHDVTPETRLSLHLPYAQHRFPLWIYHWVFTTVWRQSI